MKENRTRPVLTAKKYISALAAILVVIILTGCYDQREIDDQAYPVAIGLDIGQQNKLRLTLQLAAPLSIGSGGGGEGAGSKGGEGGETTSIITVDTPSIYSGLNLVNNIISKEINMAHTKVVIISRKLAESGVTEYLRAIKRGREFRPNMYVLVSNEPPDEYLRNVKPTLESNPAKYYELILDKKFTSFYPKVKIQDFYMRAESNAIEPVAIFTGLSHYENVEQIKETGESGKDAVRPEGHYVAGEIPIVADQKNVIMGLAVFKKGKMVGVLNGTESACHQMIMGEYNYSYWTLQDPQDENNIVVVIIYQRKKPHMKVELNDKGNANIHIALDLEGDLVSIPSGFNYEGNPELIERKVVEVVKKNVTDLLNKTKNQFDSDICGFGNHVRKKFLTWDQWEKLNWLEQYRHTNFNVDVSFKIRRTGLMVRTIH